MKATEGIVVVTGSNGRIGDAVMRRFAGQFDVVGFDRKAEQPPPPGCVYMPVDVTSDASVTEGLSVLRAHHGSRIASVVHLAAYYDFLGRPSPMYEQVTVRGTERLLRGLHALDFAVDQFVFSSTMLVHKSSEPGLLIAEDSPVLPTWAYPRSKVQTEEVILRERGTIPAVLLRVAGIYDDRCHSIPLAHQIQRIHERQFTASLYSGSTSHGQAFLHMDDLVSAIELTVNNRSKLPTELVLLLGEAETLTYDELQHTLARLIHGESLETIEIPRVLAPFAKLGAWLMQKLPGADTFIRPWMIDRANDHYALDITRAITHLDWQPHRSLRATLPTMIATLKADPVAFYKENELGQPPRHRNAT